MKGLKLFWEFAKVSVQEIMLEKKIYLNAFFALVFLDNIETFYPLLGIAEESNASLTLTVVSTFLTFIVLSQVVLIQKRKKGGSDTLRYFVPTFLLYNLYYSFLFFLGLLFFIVPGFYVLFYFSMVPLIAVLDDSSEGHYFSRSKRLVKKNVSLVVWTSLINLLVELAAFIIVPLQNPTLKMTAKLIFSLPDAFLTLTMTIVTVKVFYYLMDHDGSKRINSYTQHS